MAVSLNDILSQFRYDLAALPGVVSAYCTFRIEPTPKVHLWTILERRDEDTERRLAAAERRVVESFPRVPFDFTTTHLQGRDPIQFVPEGAIEVILRPPASSLTGTFTYTDRHVMNA